MAQPSALHAQTYVARHCTLRGLPEALAGTRLALQQRFEYGSVRKHTAADIAHRDAHTCRLTAARTRDLKERSRPCTPFRALPARPAEMRQADFGLHQHVVCFALGVGVLACALCCPLLRAAINSATIGAVA